MQILFSYVNYASEFHFIIGVVAFLLLCMHVKVGIFLYLFAIHFVGTAARSAIRIRIW